MPRGYAPYYATGVPEAALFKVTDGVESQTAYEYDGLDRVTAEKFLTGNGIGQEKWRTTTRYGGDRIHVDPPIGGTPTTTITDARERTTEIRQHKGDGPNGDYDSTTYSYGLTGQLSKVTDSSATSGRTPTTSVAGRSRLRTLTREPPRAVTTTSIASLRTATARPPAPSRGHEPAQRGRERRARGQPRLRPRPDHPGHAGSGQREPGQLDQ